MVHIRLDAGPADFIAPGPRCWIIFWWGDWPVGQAEHVGEAGQKIALEPLVERTVAADVLTRARKATEAEALKPTPGRPSVSVVICTRDRPDELARCLASLPQQTLVPSQVVVVDNASVDDRTRAAAWAAGVDYLREDRPGLDIARNAGTRAAIGELILYTDDDVLLHPRWAERLVAAFDSPEILGVTGLVLPAELETGAQEHFERHWSFGRGYSRIDFGREFFASDKRFGCAAWNVGAGASMAFRREVFETIGYFDERLDVGAAGCSGDSEYWHRLLTSGGVCRYEPSAVAFHYHRRDYAGLSKQIFHYMRGHSAALLVQFERSGNLGNLRRALWSLPGWYARRLARVMVRGRSEHDRFLRQEIAGYASGLRYYWFCPRSDRGSGR